MTPKGQKKIKPTAELRDAKPGDIIMSTKVLYRVESVTWIKAIWRGYDMFNQKMIVTRLVDDKRFKMWRCAMKQQSNGVSISTDAQGNKTHRFGLAGFEPTEDMIGTDTSGFNPNMTDAEFAEGVAQWVARGYGADTFVRYYMEKHRC